MGWVQSSERGEKKQKLAIKPNDFTKINWSVSGIWLSLQDLFLSNSRYIITPQGVQEWMEDLVTEGGQKVSPWFQRKKKEMGLKSAGTANMRRVKNERWRRKKQSGLISPCLQDTSSNRCMAWGGIGLTKRPPYRSKKNDSTSSVWYICSSGPVGL